MSMPFITFLNKIHKELVCGQPGQLNITANEREQLAVIIEGMTNIDTINKIDVFNELCSVYPNQITLDGYKRDYP